MDLTDEHVPVARQPSTSQPALAHRFSFRGARSASITVAIAGILVVETAALHLLLVRRHPVGAWGLTLMSLAATLWLLADYRALGRGVIVVDDAMVWVTIGLRITAEIPRLLIATAIVPSWRELPTTGREYLNGMKPSTPNVLVTFRQPVSVRLLGVFTRFVRQLGMHLDDPEAFLAALGFAPSQTPSPVRSVSALSAMGPVDSPPGAAGLS